MNNAKKTAKSKVTALLPKAADFIKELTLLAKQKKSDNARFFHGPDSATKFLNVRMASVFSLAKTYQQMPLLEIDSLLASEFYEVRLGAVSIMDFKARDKKTSAEEKKSLYNLYIKRHDRINNWDLIDRSAPYAVGGYLFDKPRTKLYKLALSKNVWERRTAIVSTYFFIRQNEIDDTFNIAELLLTDKQEVINKAVGSWVREAGKRDKKKLLAFLDKHAWTMPRVTLRYAIEKLDKKLKDHYMKAA